MPEFTTGPATLPDVGTLFYNGCFFSPLFETVVSGKVVQDAANRTTKFMEYTITVDGYVTLPDSESTIESTTLDLRQMLTAQGGALIYKGRSTNLTVNAPGGTLRDAAWGPIPDLLEFQPLGAGRSAKVKWAVKTRIPEVVGVGSSRFGPVLQFNEETSVTYDDAGYSTLSVKGTLEIPLTRVVQDRRTLDRTVDDFRAAYLNGGFGLGGADGRFDLTRFRVTRRDFNVSRDKRTMEWDFAIEELPPQGLPPDVTIARGSYSFRPAKAGLGLANWMCTLRVTYTVRKDKPRRTAWLAFLALLRVRMAASVRGVIGPENRELVARPVLPIAPLFGGSPLADPFVSVARRLLGIQNKEVRDARKAWLMDFSGDEGLYLDSKTITFSATWRLITTFNAILVASGLWRYVPSDGGNTWATSMRDISGSQSWLDNNLNPAASVIVDFGGP